MTDVIGRGVIEVSADATKLKAGIEDAKRSVKSLGGSTRDENTKNTASIDRYIKRLETQAAVQGKSARQAELYRLAQRGASAEQLKSADAALKLQEAFARGERIGTSLRTGFIAIGTAATAAATGLTIAAVAFDALVKKAGNFQDLAEKTGDSAENIAGLAVAAGTAGKSIDEISTFAVKLSKNLTGVDDEAKASGAAITALGLDLKAFKALAPVERIEALSKALATFNEGPEKGDALEAIAKGGAQLLPFLKELDQQNGRQIILTRQQIALADEYSDKQAKARAQLTLYAQAAATQAIPALTNLNEAANKWIAQLIGIDAETGKLAANNSIADFAESGAKALAYLVDVADRATRALIIVGKTAAATAATGKAVVFGNPTEILRSVQAIGDAYTEDVLKIGRAPLLSETLAQVQQLRREKPAIEAMAKLLGGTSSLLTPPAKKKLVFDGATTKDTTAAAEAKAQLALDLEQIRKASDAITNGFANGEKIMEALRRADLIDEREYYAAKRGYLIANEAEQADALQREIARLQAEKVTGKDRLENERKIADAQARLSKVKADTAANISVLSIQEVAALKAIEIGYRQAEDAAQEFLDSIRRGHQRELSGFGAGQATRNLEAGRAQIEDKFEADRRRLEQSRRDSELSGTFGGDAQRKYDNELELIRRFRTQALAEFDQFAKVRIAQEQSVALGASEAFNNYVDLASQTAAMTEQLFTNAFNGMEDALVQFVTTGKLNFKALASSIVADITRIIVKQQISNAIGVAGSGEGGGFLGTIVGGLSALFGSTGGAASSGAFGIGVSGLASGGPAAPGSIHQVNEKGPELLTVGGRQYLMMGDQPGRVEPADAGSTGGSKTTERPVTVVNNFTLNGPADRRTQQQVAAAAGASLRSAVARIT